MRVSYCWQYPLPVLLPLLPLLPLPETLDWLLPLLLPPRKELLLEEFWEEKELPHKLAGEEVVSWGGNVSLEDKER